MKRSTKGRFFKRSLFRYLRLIMLPLLIFSILQQVITISGIRSETAVAEKTRLLQLETSMNYVLDEMEAFVVAFDQDSLYSSFSDILKKPALTYERNVALRIVRDWLRSIANARSYIDSIYVYVENDNGRFIKSDDGVTHLKELMDTQWMDSFMEKRKSMTQWTWRRPYVRYGFEKDHSSETVSVFRTVRSARGLIVLNLSPLYMKNQLRELLTYPGQELLVLGPDDELLFSSTDAPSIPLATLIQKADRFIEGRTFSIDGFSVTTQQDGRYGWRYMSLVPNDVLFALSNRLLWTSIMLLSICTLLCFLQAYRHTMRNNRRLTGIYVLIDAAAENKPLPPLPSRAADEYSYIEQNILKTFIDKSMIQKQLHEKNYQLKTLEMMALQAQISPHFLVNTLNTVFWNSLALTGGPNNVSEMIEDLSQLLVLLVGEPKEEVALEEEVEYLKCYIDIQSKRFPDRFVFNQDIAKDAMPVKILKLVLQPLVENCVTHALAPDRVVLIRLRAQIEGEMLIISVSDDGEGIDMQKLDTLRALTGQPIGQSHIGLVNTIKRLILFYDVEMPVTIQSEKGKGTEVRITLPIQAGGLKRRL